MKKSLFLMMLIILLLTSCTRSAKHGPPIVAGVYDNLEISGIVYEKEEERREWWISDFDKKEKPEEFDLIIKATIKEITEEEYNNANCLNVVKDMTYRGENKCYSLEILIGYTEDTLEQVDYILFEDSNSNGQRAYNYEFDRGMLLFNGDSFYVNITYDRNETYHNKTILDDLGYDFIWIKSSERFDRED